MVLVKLKNAFYFTLALISFGVFIFHNSKISRFVYGFIIGFILTYLLCEKM